MPTIVDWPLIPQPIPSSLRTVWFQPMGFSLKLVTNSPAIIKAAEASFAGFGPAIPSTTPDINLRLIEHTARDVSLQAPRFWLDGLHMMQCTGPDSALAVNLASGCVFGHISSTITANPSFFRWHYLDLAFFMMLEARGLMGVHGSALVKNGQAILLRAASGGGKTTLAYAGARRNLQALAEDVVWLDPRQNYWWGMPWSFHLLPDAKTLFSELAPFQPVLQTSGELKLEVNPEKIRAGSTTVSAEPRAIIFLERLPGESSWLNIIDAITAQTMWPAATTGLEMQLPHHAGHISKLFQLPAYHLTFGDDIEHALDLLEETFI